MLVTVRLKVHLHKILTVKVILFLCRRTNVLWVDKYHSVKQIIGQQGDKSNMRKLMNWLRDWGKKLKELIL